MHLTDLIGKDDLISLQNELHDTFNFNADIMDADGKKLVGNTWGNELCPAIRDDAKGFGAICAPRWPDVPPYAQHHQGAYCRVLRRRHDAGWGADPS